MSSLSQLCKTLPKRDRFATNAKIMSDSRPRLKFRGDKYKLATIHSENASFYGYYAAKKGHMVLSSCFAKHSNCDDNEEQTALHTVHKLYEAMRNRDVHQISHIIAEECLCFSNFFSTFQPFHGKKQVLHFFSCLMKNLGNNIEFAVQNTLEDGMVVAVSWKLEWNNVPLPLGKGFSFYTCHVYRGKVMIKNVEIFMEPFLHIEPLRLRIMNAIKKLNLWALIKKKRRLRPIDILIILQFMAAILFLLKYCV